MAVCLDTLDLTFEEREAAREAIRCLAHTIWLEAGCPEGADVDCWLKAERRWIETQYVPHRAVDGLRPALAPSA
jgi:hypothetical protein